MNFWATGVSVFFLGSLIFSNPWLASFSLHPLRLLFLSLQNIQFCQPFVKLFLPVLFLVFPGFLTAATFKP